MNINFLLDEDLHTFTVHVIKEIEEGIIMSC
jgi:hypothetical protein